jgi:hypothetical protein
MGGVATVTIIKPRLPKKEKSVPMYAFVPWRSKTREFGVAGNPTGPPTVLFGAAIEIRRLVHPVVVAQLPAEGTTPVLDTKTVAVVVEVVVPVVKGATTTFMALSG